MDINPSNPSSTSTYIAGRKKYSRPQAMLWSDNSGNIDESKMRFPSGKEKEDFIICSDHNRKEMNINQQRIESRQRMINGTMRSYHIADKIALSVSWERLPSRSFSRNVIFDSSGKAVMSETDQEYTVDGGAGGVELLDWYENHSGPFYVYLGYDKFNSNSLKVVGNVEDASFTHLGIYNDVRMMYFSNFDYTIEKRGGTNFDFWTVNVGLEEV
jgi:hypothetical protein